MPGYRIFCVVLVFCCAACTSPEDRIFNAQERLLLVLQKREYFHIVSGKQTLKLPLPPGEALAAANRKTLAEMEVELQGIDNQKLDESFQQKRRELLAALRDIREKGVQTGFDPVSCVITGQLRELAGNASLSKVFMEKIPEYYAAVENRWQPCAVERAREAAAESLDALDVLDSLRGPEAARLAVKDFIGHCNSAVLGQ